MNHSNKFMKGILIGAVVGGAISLLDKNTRTSVMSNCRQRKEKILTFMKNPDIVFNQLKDKTGEIKNTVGQVTEDITFITEKVTQLTELTPQVTSIVKETKEVFESNDEKKAELLDED